MKEGKERRTQDHYTANPFLVSSPFRSNARPLQFPCGNIPLPPYRGNEEDDRRASVRRDRERTRFSLQLEHKMDGAAKQQPWRPGLRQASERRRRPADGREPT